MKRQVPTLYLSQMQLLEKVLSFAFSNANSNNFCLLAFNDRSQFDKFPDNAKKRLLFHSTVVKLKRNGINRREVFKFC
jgi:hypothetical protein